MLKLLFAAFDACDALFSTKIVRGISQIFAWAVQGAHLLLFFFPLLALRLLELVAKIVVARFDEAYTGFFILIGHDVDPPKRSGFRLTWSFDASWWTVDVVSFERSKLTNPPLSKFQKVLQFLMPKKIYKRVFETTMNDGKDEYLESLAAGEKLKAWYIANFYRAVLVCLFCRMVSTSVVGLLLSHFFFGTSPNKLESTEDRIE